MIGIDHNVAPVSVRSAFFLTKENIVALMKEVKETLPAEGAVVLSTCNRLEIWTCTGDPADRAEAPLPLKTVPEDHPEPVRENDPVYRILCRLCKVNPPDYAFYFVKRTQEPAVSHLFYLTSGLRSAILAEDQVLTQVKQALDFSRTNHLAGSCMEVLFRTAVTAAKKIKTDVTFTRANSSAIDQAISRLESEGLFLKGKTCMVIGNGEYGRLAATTLLEHGADVMMTLRQYHSQKAAPPSGCRSVPYDDRYLYMPECTVVVSATASPHYTIKKERLLDFPDDRHIILLDLAIPRDIEPEIKALPQFTLYDIDDFYTADNNENAEAFLKAEEIIRKFIEEYSLWEHSRDLFPRIQKIQDNAVNSLNLRLLKSIRKLPLPEEDKEQLLSQIDQAAGKVLNKLLFDLQDYLPEKEFRQCIQGMENIYPDPAPGKAGDRS